MRWRRLGRQHVELVGGLCHVGWIQVAVWRGHVLVVQLLLLLDLEQLVLELLLLNLHGIVDGRWEPRRHCWVQVACRCRGLLVVRVDLLVVLGSQLRVEKDC